MNQTVSIQCGERLSIERVEDLYNDMDAALRNGSDIELEADRVQFCDTAGLQLVLSLQQALSASGHQLLWKEPTDVIYETSQLIGLQDLIGLPIKAA